jgi:hypothetical protein
MPHVLRIRGMDRWWKMGVLVAIPNFAEDDPPLRAFAARIRV